MNQETINILLLISPLIIGGIIAAVNTLGVNDTTEKAEAWVRRTQANVSTKKSWLYKYILNPLLWTVVKFSDWTDSFIHRGLKNGIRVAATLYLIVAWCFILYTAFKIAVMIIIVGVILYVLFKVLAGSSDDNNSYPNYESPRKGNVTDTAGVHGQKIYSGTNWFNEELKGRVDEEGNIYKGKNWFNEEKIGRIDKDGNIYKGTNYFNEEKTGRIDEDGDLHRGTNWFNEEKVGRIDEDGNIHKGTNWFNEEKIGRTGK